VVRRPDADPLAAPEAEREQPRGKGIDPLLQLAIGPADALVPDDQRVAIAKPLGGPVEIDPDRLADQRLRRCAMDITQPGHLVFLLASAPRVLCNPRPQQSLNRLRRSHISELWIRSARFPLSAPGAERAGDPSSEPPNCARTHLTLPIANAVGPLPLPPQSCV